MIQGSGTRRPAAMRTGRRLVAAVLAAALFAGLIVLGHPVGAVPIAGLDFLGRVTLANGTTFEGTRVGGLSGIDYDPATGTFYAISDDGRHGPRPGRFPRFYTLDIDFSGNTPEAVRVTGVHEIRGLGGGILPSGVVDPEAIRLDPADGTLVWASEGNAAFLVPPSMRRMTTDGRFAGAYLTPARYLPRADRPAGVRANRAFESLALAPDGRTLFTATENALRQDGPKPRADVGSPVRILQMHRSAAFADPTVAEYVYELEPLPTGLLPATPLGTNGLVDLIAVDDGRLIAVERAFDLGIGYSVRLYLVDLEGATDVSGIESLAGERYRTVAKTLLLDLSELGLVLDNIEGITFGPTLADGRRSLILVSDDNFNPLRSTQVLAFAVDAGLTAVAAPLPAGWLLLAPGLALLAATALRRRRSGRKRAPLRSGDDAR